MPVLITEPPTLTISLRFGARRGRIDEDRQPVDDGLEHRIVTSRTS